MIRITSENKYLEEVYEAKKDYLNTTPEEIIHNEKILKTVQML